MRWAGTLYILPVVHEDIIASQITEGLFMTESPLDWNGKDIELLQRFLTVIDSRPGFIAASVRCAQTKFSGTIRSFS